MNLTEGSKRILLVLIGLIVLFAYIFLGSKLFFFLVFFFAGLIFIIWYVFSGFAKEIPTNNDNADNVKLLQKLLSKAKNVPRRRKKTCGRETSEQEDE